MSNRPSQPKTFLDVYSTTIAPKLREIDLYLKEKEMPATIWQVSQLLDIPYSEVVEIIHNLKIENLNHESILKIIMNGSSMICGLIRRETERGFPYSYLPIDISYIYEINERAVAEVFEMLGLSQIKESCLPLVFHHLSDFDSFKY